jgi:hypothetical protein
MKRICDIDPQVLAEIRKGAVIPAQPLALDENRQFVPKHQRALCRYYIDAGAGGIAVGVHSTQFERLAAKYLKLPVCAVKLNRRCMRPSSQKLTDMTHVCSV